MIKVTKDYIIDLDKVQAYIDSDAWESDSGPRRAKDFKEEDQLRYSLDGLLNDYYEDEIKELPEGKRDQARLFIEDGLLVAGRRVGMLEGVEKELFKVDDQLLAALLDSRLIRVENTHLGRSFEVSHDALVDPILKSKRERNALEELEENRQRIRAVRRRLAVSSIVAVVSLALLGLAIFFYLDAVDSEEAERVAKLESESRYIDLQKAQLEGARARYQSFISSGQQFMSEGTYDQAIASFNRAIETIDYFESDTDLPTPRDSIDNNGQEAQKLLAESIEKSGVGAQFNALINRGDAFERRGNEYLVNARTEFNKALALGYNNKLANSRLVGLQGKLSNAFEKFIKEGNTFYDAPSCSDALRQYNQAQRIKPITDTKVLERIQECKAKL